MVSKEVTVVNPEGLHFRPAGALVKACKAYPGCMIRVSLNGKTADAKGFLSVSLLGAHCGSTVTITCDGEDEEKALADITERIANGFGL